LSKDYKVRGARVKLLPVSSVENVKDKNRSMEEVLLEVEGLKQELEKERTLLKEVIKQVPSGVIIAEAPSGRFILGNEQAERIWGKPYMPKELPLVRSIMTGEVVINEEIDFPRGDGTHGTQICSSSPICDEEGRIIAGVMTFRDVTERRQVEEALRKAQDGLEECRRSQEQLRASLQEKEILLREIHHRVKNNMAIISSLLTFQSELSDDKKVIEMFNESQNRIMSMALIHEKLYQSESLSKIDLKEYIYDLVNGLIQSYEADTGKIALNLNVEDISLGISSVIPCGLIINELVTNALKYAFPEGKKGEIKVSLCSTNENMIELSVGDNGAGVPEDFDFRKTKSLGLYIVTMLVENQLHGEIKLNRDKGTEFQIKFKGGK